MKDYINTYPEEQYFHVPFSLVFSLSQAAPCDQSGIN